MTDFKLEDGTYMSRGDVFTVDGGRNITVSELLSFAEVIEFTVGPQCPWLPFKEAYNIGLIVRYKVMDPKKSIRPHRFN